jgi:hypothetical protein
MLSSERDRYSKDKREVQHKLSSGFLGSLGKMEENEEEFGTFGLGGGGKVTSGKRVNTLISDSSSDEEEIPKTKTVNKQSNITQSSNLIDFSDFIAAGTSNSNKNVTQNEDIQNIFSNNGLNSSQTNNNNNFKNNQSKIDIYDIFK